MIDINLVKIAYSRMSDQELIQLAQNESRDLTTEALAILKDEFSIRGLSMDAFNPPETNQTNEEFDMPIEGFQNHSVGAGDIVKEFNHLKGKEEDVQIKREDAILQGEEQVIAGVTTEELEKLIAKSNRNMWINGIICIAGAIATLVGLEQANQGNGGFIVWYGAIAFGALGFLGSYFNKKKFKAILFNLPLRKENEQNSARGSEEI